MRLVTWAAAVAIFAMVAFALARPVSAANKFEGGTASVPCGEGQVVYSPIQLWPPNHQMRTISVTYIDNSAAGATQGDNDGDQETLTINSITDNQTAGDDAGGNGCGQKTSMQGPDWTFSSNPINSMDPQNIGTMVQVRAERCAKDETDPRIYKINVTCGNPDAGSSSKPTTVDLNVTVPHDKAHAEKVD
ncbi:MAG TPA: hypothetical protein VKB29_12985 [Candidatus Binataceae bacterium]|nr:hypothetical protein [Candidatus Binataceae bacterium]